MSKENKLEVLKTAFRKHRVLDIKKLSKIINTSSRSTIFRYLRELKHLTSYTHSGKYYTLPEIAQFEEDGFWHYGDISFSLRGTLVNTLEHVITMSESGKTNPELEKYFRIRVQESLRALLQTKKIAREKIASHNLYLNPNSSVSAQQIKKRQTFGSKKKLPSWIVAEILIETIRACSSSPQIEDVMKRLKKRRSSITYDQVKQVFEEESLEKKTLD